MEDAVIAGAGPIGLACAVSAKRRGLDPLLLDAGVLVHSITRYPIGMTFFTTPERMEIGGHPLVCAGQKPTREEGLKYYRGVARVEGVRFQAYRRLVAAEPRDGSLECVVTGRGGEPRPGAAAQGRPEHSAGGPDVAGGEVRAAHRAVEDGGWLLKIFSPSKRPFSMKISEMARPEEMLPAM